MTLSRRAKWRRLRFGLTTLLQPQKPLGFFIPYRFARTVQQRQTALTYVRCQDVLSQHQNAFLEVLKKAEAYVDVFGTIGQAPSPAPRWDQDWFSGLDAVAAYTLIRQSPPARLIEVGAGHSTRFFAKAREDGGQHFDITTIDPEPRTTLTGLDLHHVQQDVTDTPAEIWGALVSGDILSIDSSHILMPGTDVDFLLNQVLPTLPVGVRLHVHDIFLPDPYPAPWQWRGYNEQSGIAALLGTGAYRPVFASHFVRKTLEPTLEKSPLWPFVTRGGAPSSSLWLEKTF